MRFPLHGLGRKLKNKNPFTNHKKKTKKVSRLPHTKHFKRHFAKIRNRRKSGKGFPLVKALKVPDSVPSVSLNTLAKYAKDHDKNGAVQEVGHDSSALKSSNLKAYTVIVADEKSLISAGLTTKSPDFGDLSAAIKQGLIESATMRSDLSRGEICLIPSHDTLEILGQYDELKKIVYHWGLFFSTFSDSSDNNHVKVLNTTVDYKELLRIDLHHPTLSMTSDGKLVSGKDMVAAGRAHWSNSDGSSDSAPKTPKASNKGSKSTSGAPKPASKETASRGPIQRGGLNTPGAEQTNNNGANTKAPNNAKPSSDKPSAKPTGPSQQNVPKPRSTGNPNIGIPHIGGGQPRSAINVGGSSSVNPQSSAADSSRMTRESARADSASASKTQTSVSNNANSSDGIDSSTMAKLAAADPATAQALKVLKQTSNASYNARPANAGSKAPVSSSSAYASSNNISRKSLFNDPSEPKQSPQDYTQDLDDFGTQTYYDTDLGFHVDMRDFEYILKRDKPRRIPLIHVRPGNKLDVLLNSQIKQMNQRLLTLHKHHLADIMDHANGMVSSLSEELDDVYDPNNGHTNVGRKAKKIRDDYQNDQSNQTMVVNSLQSSEVQQYADRRASYMSGIANRARAEYDSNHRDELERKKEELKGAIDNNVRQHHLQQVADFNKWRRSVAQRFVRQEIRSFQKAINETREQDANKEDICYNEFQRKLGIIKENHFDAESKREQAINDAKQHDDKIESLQRSVQNTINGYTDKIKAIKAEDQRRAANEARAGRQRINDIINEKKQLQDNIEDAKRKLQAQVVHARKDVADEFRHRLAVQADQNKALHDEQEKQEEHYKVVRDKQKHAYEAKLAEQRRQRLEAKQQSEDRLNSLSQVIRNMRMDSDPNHKDKNNNDDSWGKMAILAVIGTLLAGGGYLVHGATNAHVDTEQTSQASSANSQKAQSSASVAASSASASASTSASASIESVQQRINAEKRSHHNHSKSTNHSGNLMTYRPKHEKGRFIGKSSSKHPRNYMYVMSGRFKPGSQVYGYENNHKVKLRVSKVQNHRVLVKDPSNHQAYEFNV